MPVSHELKEEVQYLKGVGPSVAEKLRRLGIGTINDLIYYFPRDYEDRRNLTYVRDIQDGQKVTCRVVAAEHSTFYYRGKHHLRIKVTDPSGSAYLYCFHRNYLKETLKIGATFYLTGTASRKKGLPVFSQFDYAFGSRDDELRVLPVYALTAGLSQKKMRSLTAYALDSLGERIAEDLPDVIRSGYKIPAKRELVRSIHFPEDMNTLRRAKEGLSYEEFFKYQLAVAILKNRKVEIQKPRKHVEGHMKRRFLDNLPFSFTAAQQRVLRELEGDMARPAPMNRLIQGDVGSGKTVVSLICALDAIEGGGQVALMAPTEVLARQHHATVLSLVQDLDLRTEFLSGSVRGAERSAVLEGLARGEVHILVGTHALFSEEVIYHDLSLVIIDEQQKFGVLQRGSLREKGDHPDCVVMSATPIPRTLSMTLYGDLDVSVIDELPAGRGTIFTDIVRQAEIERVYQRVREEVSRGRQAYFIYPLIEESLKADLKNALDAYEHLRREVFPGLRVGLLHGRMEEEEKQAAMAAFKAREHDILVSTTVIEVGIDVSNATVMVIEQAERFGLSSIHQLRGRIGRGVHDSYCFLVPDRSTGRESFSRLMILRDTDDGFKIAEWDLKLRGPGEIVGRRQSGVPSFIIDNLDINTRLIARAQKDTRRFVEGEIGTEEERQNYLQGFVGSQSFRDAVLYFGG
jgi:ATP-dependent DNA helicase RecG